MMTQNNFMNSALRADRRAYTVDENGRLRAVVDGDDDVDADSEERTIGHPFGGGADGGAKGAVDVRTGNAEFNRLLRQAAGLE